MQHSEETALQYSIPKRPLGRDRTAVLDSEETTLPCWEETAFVAVKSRSSEPLVRCVRTKRTEGFRVNDRCRLLRFVSFAALAGSRYPAIP